MKVLRTWDRGMTPERLQRVMEYINPLRKWREEHKEQPPKAER